jgi:hypothetical protein
VPDRRRYSAALFTAGAVFWAVLFIPIRLCHAQLNSHGPANSQTDITLRGTITSMVSISVEGSANGGATTTITGSGTQGVVDFGIYDLAGPLANGEKQRVNKNPKGNYLVATLTVTAFYTGAGGLAAIDIQRANPCGGPPDVSCAGAGSLFYAKMIPRKPRQKHLSWPNWNEPPGGTPMPGVFAMPTSAYVPGTGNLDNQMLSGDFIDHQVGIWIPDVQGPGPFSTVVTYTVTRL